ncbi:C3HC4 finger protein [Aspergillus candidus]|uniref:RING-type domain-containing protein n=1 Tax=Aspergillus candidus TaxID=41067 RepID=A0A2I2F592_ASPCN|nr:hypothetical protein BDW47DRAFT_59736 [Aspergillus candidus]PLB35819.1 hypothetical protein BDW47DRAFT_59736 [Aspergillus candidus]
MNTGSGQGPVTDPYLGIPMQGMSFDLPPNLFGPNMGQPEAMGGNMFQLASDTNPVDMPVQSGQSSQLPSPDTMQQQMHSRAALDNWNPTQASDYQQPPPLNPNPRSAHAMNQLNPPYNLMGWVYPPLVQPVPNVNPAGSQYPPVQAVPNQQQIPQVLQQHLARVRPSVNSSQPPFRHRNSAPYPQVGGGVGMRRHHRSSSSVGSVGSTRQPSSRNSVNGHRQTRPAPVNNAHQSTPTQPSSDRQPGPTVHRSHPWIPPDDRDRLELARQLHMARVQSNEIRLYHEAIAQSQRRYETLDINGQSPLPKSLDSKNDGRPEPKETDDLTVNMECKICMSQLVDTVMLPCGHAILCRWCAEQHMPSGADRTRPKSKALCPVCRGPVKYKFRIYLS